MNNILVELSRDDLVIIHQALNEVCHGVHIEDWEFATRLGATRDEVRQVMDRLREAFDSQLKEL